MEHPAFSPVLDAPVTIVGIRVTDRIAQVIRTSNGVSLADPLLSPLYAFAYPEASDARR